MVIRCFFLQIRTAVRIYNAFNFTYVNTNTS